jgi:hypothetical protein
MLLPLAGGSSTVVTLRELMMILELHRQGLKVSEKPVQKGRCDHGVPEHRTMPQLLIG